MDIRRDATKCIDSLIDIHPTLTSRGVEKGLIDALKNILIFQSGNYDIDGAGYTIKALCKVSREDTGRVLRSDSLKYMF